MRQETKEMRRFMVKDAAGKKVTVIEFQEFIQDVPFVGKGWIEGLNSLVTTDGKPVDSLGEGKYKVSGSEDIFTAVDGREKSWNKSAPDSRNP